MDQRRDTKRIAIITTGAHSGACYLARQLRGDDVEISVVNQVAPLVRPRSWPYYRRLLRRRGPWVCFDNILLEILRPFARVYTSLHRRFGSQRGESTSLAFPMLRNDPQLRNETWLHWFDVAAANSAEGRAVLGDIAPDLTLLYGSPILSGATLDALSGICLNPHYGILPDYGGAGPVDWALYRRDWHKIGFTIHHVTAQVDSGPIIYQEAVRWDPQWSMHYIRCYVSQALLDKLVQISRALLGGEQFPAREQQATVRPPAGAITWVLAGYRKRRYARNS